MSTHGSIRHLSGLIALAFLGGLAARLFRCLSLLFFASFCHTSKQLLHNPLKISIFARYFKGQPSGVGLYFWNDMNDENNGKFEKEIGYENRFIGYENKFINFHGYSVLRLWLNCKKCKVKKWLKKQIKMLVFNKIIFKNGREKSQKLDEKWQKMGKNSV